MTVVASSDLRDSCRQSLAAFSALRSFLRSHELPDTILVPALDETASATRTGIGCSFRISVSPLMARSPLWSGISDRAVDMAGATGAVSA